MKAKTLMLKVAKPLYGLVQKSQLDRIAEHCSTENADDSSGAMLRAPGICGRILALTFFVFALSVASIHAQSLTESNLTSITFDQKLNAQVSLDLRFRDENGKSVRLGDYFRSKPVVLVMGYYECPMLCTLTANGMIESLEDLKWDIGKQFDVVHVSINPKETPELAAEKKQTYLKRYGRSGAAEGWHFLTGDEPAIKTLANEVGFHYAYDPAVKQYAHPSGLVILTPEGKVAKYLFGVKFSPNEFYAALKGASGNQIGSRIQQLVLLCFCYSPIKGKYGKAIMLGVRIFGGATLVGLGWMFVSMMRRDRRRAASILTSPEQSRSSLESPADSPHNA